MGGHTRWYWGITDFVRCGDSSLVMFARRFLGLDTTGISGWVVLCGGAVPCAVRHLVTLWASTHQSPEVPPSSPTSVVTNRNVSGHC